jgi:hypothetical protein
MLFPLIAIFGTPAALTAGETNEKDQAAIADLRRQLEKPVSAEMLDMPMARALELLARRAGVKVMLLGRNDRDVFKQPVNMVLDGARAIDILDVLCEEANLFYEIRPNELRIASIRDQRARRVVFYNYDVSDLTSTVKDYPSPLGVFCLLHDPTESSIGGNAFMSSVDTAQITPASIADVIRARVRPDTWDPALGTSIEERSGRLIIMQTEDVHAMIRRLLAGFRSRAGRQVGVDAKVLAVNSVDLDKLLGEMKTRGVPTPAFDEQGLTAVEQWVANGTAERLYEGSTVIYHTQLGRLGDLRAKRMLTDLEVSGDTFDYLIRNVYDGTMICFRPTLSDDGTSVSMSVRAAHVKPVGEPESFTVVRGGGLPSSQSISSEQKKEGGGTMETTIQGSAAQPPRLVQLPTIVRSRVSQDMVFTANRYAALFAPMGGEKGSIPGREMLILMRCRPLIAKAPPMEPEKIDIAEMPAELKQRLTRKVNLTLIETPFQKAIEVFSAQAGIPVVLDRPALGDRLTAPVMLELKEAPASEALDLLLRAGTAAVIPHTSLLQVTSRQKVNAKRVSLRVFDIRDVTTSLDDYPGERVGDEEVSSAGGAGVSFVQPTLTPGLSAPDMAQLIRERLMPEQFADATTSIEEQAGKLVVVNTPEALARVEEILNDTRKNIQRPILLTTRWAIVNTADLKEIYGNDLPETVEPGDVPKLIALLTKPATRMIGASRLSCFNAQRVSSFGGAERSQIDDYDVSGDQNDPILRSKVSGLITEIEPRLMEGTGEQGFPSQFRLELRMVLSRTDMAPPALDPIPQGPDAQVDSRPGLAVRSGKIHMPTTDRRQVETTARVADGGAVLFRFTAPEWIDGEDAAAIKKGERAGIVIVQAEQPK